MIDTKSKKALKSGIWYTISNFLSKGIVFLTTPIFTRIMTVEAYGKYSSFVTWQSLLLLVLPLALYSTINRARLDFPGKMNEFLSSITLMGSIFTLISYVIVLLFRDFFQDFFRMDMIYINIMFMFIFFEPALSNYQGKNQVEYNYKVVTAISLSACVTSIALSIIGSLVFEDQMLGRVIGYDGTLIVLYVVIYFYILKKGHFCFNKTYISYALKLAVPLVPHLVSMYILGQCDKLVIQRLVGNEAVAFYNIGYTCALVISMLSNSVNGAMSPWLFEQLNEGQYERIRRVNRVYVSLFAYATFGLLLISPEIVWIMGGRQYADAATVLMPVMAGCCCNFVYTLYVNVENYLRRPGVISAGTTLVAIINIVLNFVFVEIYGYKAAAYTTLLSYILLLIYHYSMVKKFKYSYIYDNKLNMLLVFGICIAALLVRVIYDSPIRYFAVAGYFAITLYILLNNRKSVLAIITKLFESEKSK